MIIGTLHSGCIDPIQATARLVIILEAGIQKSDTGTTILSNGKGNFGATNRNDRTGRSVSPSLYSGRIEPKWSVSFGF